ncbi:hypothetical protein [Bacteroides stercorirosoris]|uniref:hypothetical protein n=1 Tax=Bacteroides stercorirosoris TaxID=871324 RepID=UPI0004726586|nr:hypothetical protein [Bacteroides stercorirosoris]
MPGGLWEVLWFHIACLFLIVSQYRYKRSWEKENTCLFMVCATVSGEGNGRYLSAGGGALRAYAYGARRWLLIRFMPDFID